MSFGAIVSAHFLSVFGEQFSRYSSGKTDSTETGTSTNNV